MSDGKAKRRSSRKRLKSSIRRFGNRTRNTLELLKKGRLGAPYQASFEVIQESQHYILRRYEAPATVRRELCPILFIPPLMVTSEIYDVSPELSAVSFLASQGLDVWLVDYGRPEAQSGGLERTLDDHILAADEAVDTIQTMTGQHVHLCGYSQGGMFAYQLAAYRHDESIASVITMGSPVDIRRTLFARVDDAITERVLRATRGAVAKRLAKLDGVSGALTSTGFKLFSARKELQQAVQTVGILHDREALERREPKRRFLGGEGFVAWPGPAFRKFVDDMVVDNRMLSGGIVVAGRTVALADIRCPVLYFVGERDDMARPKAVRAIQRAAPEAELHEVSIPAGHFGLVVGSKAMSEVWPCVEQWVTWRAHTGPVPELLTRQDHPEEEDGPGELSPAPEEDSGVQGLYDAATDLLDGLWHRLGDVSQEIGSVVDTLRWQLPRLARVESLKAHSRVNMGRALSEQAQAIPDATFFVWQDKAFTWSEANARVDNVSDALYAQGVRRGHHVGVLMDNHPDYLSVTAATNRLGGVGVLLNADMRGSSLRHALEVSEVDYLVVDETHWETAIDVWTGPVFLLSTSNPKHTRVVCLPHDPPPRPEELSPNPLRAAETAFLMFTSGTTGLPKAARVTNHRWAVAALTTASACRATPQDTIYCCLPLHHATGMLVAVGSALVGGTRLALAPRFSARGFWQEVRRNGATIVFYVGELCRYLINTPAPKAKLNHPVRLFVGNGMRPEVWQELVARFGPIQVLEFYGSTEGNVALANLAGTPIGSVGKPLMGSGRVALVRYDVAEDLFLRDEAQNLVPCDVDEPGLLLARIDDEHAFQGFDGYTDAVATEAKIIRDAFETGDAWFNTGDLLRCDQDGNYWFVDRLGDTFRWKGENVSTDQVERVLSAAPAVRLVAVYGVTLSGREGRAGMAAVELHDGQVFDGEALFARVNEHLANPARPRFIRVCAKLETTASLKLIKQHLKREGADPGRIGDALYWYDESAGRYSPLDMDTWVSLMDA